MRFYSPSSILVLKIVYQQVGDFVVLFNFFSFLLVQTSVNIQSTFVSTLAGKNWILQYANDAAKCNVLMQYLLKK